MKTKIHMQLCKITNDVTRMKCFILNEILCGSSFFERYIKENDIEHILAYDKKYNSWFLRLDPDTGKMKNYFNMYRSKLLLHNNKHINKCEWKEIKPE